jgi:broad specificity phosphatase PhoE
MCDVRVRSEAAVRDIAEASDGRTVLISTHNGPLMSIAAMLTGEEIENIKSLPNNSITEAEYENGCFKVIKIGYSEHLKDLTTTFKSNTEN